MRETRLLTKQIFRQYQKKVHGTPEAPRNTGPGAARRSPINQALITLRGSLMGAPARKNMNFFFMLTSPHPAKFQKQLSAFLSCCLAT